MKKFARVLVLMLALLMPLSLLSACAADEEEQQQTTAVTTAAPIVSVDPEDQYVKDQLPENLRLNKEYNIFAWESFVTEFDCTEYKQDVINDACYDRDSAVEDRLGVIITYEVHPSLKANDPTSNTSVVDWVDTVTRAWESNESYGLLAGYGRSVALLSYKGVLQDVLKIRDSYLTFESPWWTGNILEELTVGSSLYMLSGDITPSAIQQTYGTFYNLDMVEARNMKDPYEHVKAGTWTLSTLYTYIKDVEFDLNGEKGYGITTTYWTVPALFHGAGVRILDKDEETLIGLSESLFSESAGDVMEDLQEWFQEDNNMCCDTPNGEYNTDAELAFVEEHAMFTVFPISAGMRFAQQVEFKFSVVPCPKLADGVDSPYYSTQHTSMTFYAVMSGFKPSDLTDTSAVLECMASEGYRKTTPAVFETCLQGRYAQSENMREMLRLIVDTVVYDFGRIYSSSETGYVCDVIGRVIQRSDPTWSGYQQQNEQVIKSNFEKIANEFLKLQGNK